MRHTSNGTMPNEALLLVNTRFRAVLAVALTGLLFYGRAQTLIMSPPYLFSWVGGSALPVWMAVAITIAVYVVLLLVAVSLTVAPLRIDEKALTAGLAWSAAIVPVAVLLPLAARAVKYVQTTLNLIALLAAVAILLWHFRLRPHDER
jgi:hypothetical protein